MVDDIQFTNHRLSQIHYKTASDLFFTDSSLNMSDALKYYNYSADLGNIDSMLQLASIYQNGLGVPVSFTVAEKFYNMAINLNSDTARYGLALLLLSVHLTPYSRKLALRHLLVSSSNGCNLSTNHLGVLYQFGYPGIDQDIDKSIEFYTMSSKQGSAIAHNSLGIIYSAQGQHTDFKKALKHFSQAALLSSAEAQFNLGTMFQSGEGVEVNKLKAFELYMDSAKLGYVDAMYNVAMLYIDGVVQDSNNESAIYWLKKASTAGDGESSYALAELLSSSPFMNDRQLSHHYYRMSAKTGYSLAIEKLKSPILRGNLIFMDF